MDHGAADEAMLTLIMPDHHTSGSRLGPRPLALHLAQAERAWRVHEPLRLADFFRGIMAYRNHSYRRSMPPKPSVWRYRSTTLLDYGPDSAPPLLVVPSLINRGYILDLKPGASLLSFLADGGVRPFLLDWGTPDVDDRRHALDDYVLARMEGAFDWIQEATKQRPLVLGYCMGGTLATALACRRLSDCAGLALLAAPWDFSSYHRPTEPAINALALSSSMTGSTSIDLLQSLFAALDPMAVLLKFEKFSKMEPTSKAAHHFVAIEDWLNDGVPLGANIAAECFRDWFGQNAPANGQWQIAGQRVLPEMITSPTLLAIPSHDRIVPAESALALAKNLTQAEVIRPASGHVGMVAGRKAKDQLWQPLLAWLLRIAAMQKN